MKKYLSLALAAVLLTASVTACETREGANQIDNNNDGEYVMISSGTTSENTASDNSHTADITQPVSEEATKKEYYAGDFINITAGEIKDIFGEYLILDGSGTHEGPCLLLTSALYPEYNCIFEYNSGMKIDDSSMPTCVEINFGGHLDPEIYAGMKISQLYEVNRNIYYNLNAMTGQMMFTLKISDATDVTIECSNTDNAVEDIYHGNPDFQFKLIDEGVLRYLDEKQAYISKIVLRRAYNAGNSAEKNNISDGSSDTSLVFNEFGAADLSNYESGSSFVRYSHTAVMHALKDVYLYSEPDTSSENTARIPAGMTVIGWGEVDDFYYITDDYGNPDCGGYVPRDSVQGAAGYFDRTTQSVPSGMSAVGEGKVITQSDPLNIRSGPGKEYEVINQINSGGRVFVYSTGNSEWYYVVNYDCRGYASAQFISLNN